MTGQNYFAFVYVSQKPVAGKLSKLNSKFQGDFKKTGYTESICKLLRTVRNIQHHYEEQ